MENITIGQIGVALSFLVGLISAIVYLKKNLKQWVAAAFKDLYKDQFDEIKTKLGKVENDAITTQDRLGVVDLEATKNYLVYFLSRVERSEQTEEIERERFWEQFGHYTSRGGNSYIKQKVEQLKREGKL